jgi:hypothetical protein
MKKAERDYGRIYWRPGQVRVWTNTGRFLDLGDRSLDSCKRVAVELGFRLIVQSSPAPTHETGR